MKLLVINYSMNGASQVFSHQRKIVLELSKKLDEVDVITSEDFKDLPISKVKIFSTKWRPKKTFRNMKNFYFITIPLLLKHRGGIVFSHMTDVQSALIAIPCRILRIRHILWYAHKSPSIFLKFCYPFLNALVTSTQGSCPISGKKVVILGQAVDSCISQEITRPARIPPKSWYHVGRIDPSKNIEMIIRVIEELHQTDPDIQLHFYGAPSTARHEEYFQSLIKNFAQENWIKFHGQLPSIAMAKTASCHDGFVHAFWGSLDKSLVEAIMLKRVVVSGNPEFLSQFESRKIFESEVESQLRKQLEMVYRSTSEEIQDEIERRLRLAITNHELRGWIDRLLKVFQETK